MKCCITYNDITCSDNAVIVSGGDTEYCFDIGSLVLEYLSSGNLANPYTTIPFSPEIQARIKTHGSVVLRADFGIVVLNQLQTIGECILASFTKTGNIEDITSYDVRINNVSLYDFDLGASLGSVGLVTSGDCLEHVRGVKPNGLVAMHKYLSKSAHSAGEGVISCIRQELTHGKVTPVKV